MTGNTSRENGLAGYAWIGTAAGAAVANTAEANGSSGFQAEEAAAPDWTGNRSFDNAEDGFTWLNESGGVANGNLAGSNRNAGFGIDGTAAPEIRSNSARDNQATELFRGDTATPTLAENDFE